MFCGYSGSCYSLLLRLDSLLLTLKSQNQARRQRPRLYDLTPKFNAIYAFKGLYPGCLDLLKLENQSIFLYVGVKTYHLLCKFKRVPRLLFWLLVVGMIASLYALDLLI